MIYPGHRAIYAQARHPERGSTVPSFSASQTAAPRRSREKTLPKKNYRRFEAEEQVEYKMENNRLFIGGLDSRLRGNDVAKYASFI